MQQITITDKSYTEWVSQLSQRYRKSQIKAAVKVNREMLKFYWSLGRDIVKNYLDNKYGSQFYSVLSSIRILPQSSLSMTTIWRLVRQPGILSRLWVRVCLRVILQYVFYHIQHRERVI